MWTEISFHSDHGSQEIFFTQSLHVEGLDERIAMFDETILPTPSLLEALDLARGRRRLPAPTYVAENHDLKLSVLNWRSCRCP